MIRIISKEDMIEYDGRAFHLFTCFSAHIFNRFIQNNEYTFCSGYCCLQLTIYLRDFIDRTAELTCIDNKCRNDTDRDHAID